MKQDSDADHQRHTRDCVAFCRFVVVCCCCFYGFSWCFRFRCQKCDYLFHM